MSADSTGACGGAHDESSSSSLKSVSASSLLPKEKAGAAGSEAGAESVFVVLLLLGAVPANRTLGSADSGLVGSRRAASILLSEPSGDSGELPSA
jgi:hypothetical protein